MKIAFITHEFGRYKVHGGIASYLEYFLEMFLKLQRAGRIAADIELYFIYVQGPPPEMAKAKYGDTAHFTQFLPENFKDKEFYQVIAETLERENIDIVEITDFYGYGIDALVRRMLYGHHRKTFFYVNNHTATRETVNWSLGIRFPESSHRRTVEYFHREMAQYLLADHNIAPSTFLTNYLMKNIPLNYIETIPYAFNTDFGWNSSENKYRGAQGDKRVVCITRFEPRKRQENLVRATLSLMQQGRDDFTVYMAGNATFDEVQERNHKDYVESLIPENYRSRFKFFEFLSHQDFKTWYRETTVFVMPSDYENFPNAALEAIGHHVPVIASRETGVLDMVGSDQYCFNPGDIPGMANKINAVLDLSFDELKALGEKQVTHLAEWVHEDRTVIQKLEMLATRHQQFLQALPPADVPKRVFVMDFNFHPPMPLPQVRKWRSAPLLKKLETFSSNQSVEMLYGSNRTSERCHLLVIPAGMEPLEPILELFQSLTIPENLERAILVFKGGYRFPTTLKYLYRYLQDVPFILPYCDLQFDPNIKDGDFNNKFFDLVYSRTCIIPVEGYDVTMPKRLLPSSLNRFLKRMHPYS